MMDFKGFICILVLYISNINGAALPEPADSYDYHFNQLGVNFGIKFDDKALLFPRLSSKKQPF